jgi:hypothetical protein
MLAAHRPLIMRAPDAAHRAGVVQAPPLASQLACRRAGMPMPPMPMSMPSSVGIMSSSRVGIAEPSDVPVPPVGSSVAQPIAATAAKNAKPQIAGMFRIAASAAEAVTAVQVPPTPYMVREAGLS